MSSSRPTLLFGALIALSAVASWSVLAETFALASTSDEYTHILLIIPVSAALIWMGRSEFAQTQSRDLRAGAFLLLFAVGVSIIAYRAVLSPDERLSLGMFALVVWWIGAFVLSFGRKSAEAFLFPLAFLFWLIPFPNFLLNEVVGLLQKGSAACANLLFEVAGVPVAQDGIRLSIPGLTVEVATECSSIRSSMMLLVTTMVLAYLILRSPWGRALAIALAIPLSVAKNGLRIFVIAMLGTRVDPGYLHGRLHRQGGGIFFGIALLVMFVVLWVLQRAEQRSTQKLQRTIPSAHADVTPS